MENVEQLFLNVLAEGSRATEPQRLGERDLEGVLRIWRRGQTVIQTKLIGLETLRVGEQRMECLIAHWGHAKAILPVDPSFSDLEGRERERPLLMIDRWIACVVESADLSDESNRVVTINRRKARAIMQDVTKRKIEMGQRLHGVIQFETRGGYVLDVGGFSAMMPKAYYDWDPGKKGDAGEEFSVVKVPTRGDRLIVSRRDTLPNPYTSEFRFARGSVVRAHVVTMTARGRMRVQIAPNLFASVDPVGMREIPRPGDRVMLRVLGKNPQGYYGTLA